MTGNGLRPEDVWQMIHAERARLSDLLDGLSESQWESPTLCTNWNVRQTTAHLSAAARTGLVAWLWSMASSGFNADRHNARRLARQLGSTAADTARRYRDSIGFTVAPTKDLAAWLGEVIVHGQDIARSLGISLEPDPAAVAEVAHFYTSKDFAVNSHTLVEGLALRASDTEFEYGSGPVVDGPILDLVMVMAGRREPLPRLSGAGVTDLKDRIDAT